MPTYAAYIIVFTDLTQTILTLNLKSDVQENF
jgi:hypothetical protein